MPRDLIDHATLATAAVGAVLGVFNTWRTWINDRARIRVSVAMGVGLYGDRALLVEVVNLSSFPVTITHVGFDLLGTDKHMAMVTPLLVQGGKLPERLPPRTALTALQPLAALEREHLAILRNAYVLTACGLKRKSGRSLLRQFNRAALAAAVDDAAP